MIFSRKLDRTLWLMSLGKDRDLVVSFVQRMPKDFYDEVQDAIKMAKGYVLEQYDDKKKYEFKGSYNASNDMKYWYCLDLVTGFLKLGESIIYQGEEYNTIWMMLHPFDKQKYNKSEILDDHLLGYISYNFIEDYVDDEIQVLDIDVMEYSLVKMPFNTSYICTSVMESNVKKNGEIVLVEKNKYSFVNMNRIPNAYDTSMVGKRYTRTRKKKINSK